MTSTLQFWDETNSAILFDVYDSTGANASDNGYSATFLAGNLDMGSPSYEFERFNPPQADGGSTTFKRMGLRTMTFTVSMRASSYDNYATAVGRLAQLCYNGGVLKWIPDGSANTRFIDYEPSPAPFYFDGRATSLVEAVRLFGTGAGITVSLTIQPTLRGAELDSATNILTNATLLRDADGGGRPDGWTWSSTANISNETISATSEAFQFDIATAAQRQLSQVTANSTVVATETWTMSGYARVTSSSMTNVEIQAMVEFQTNAGAAVNTLTGTLIPITTAWQRISVSGVASATATKAQPGLRVDCTSATSATIQLKNFQFEKQATARPFFVGNEVGVVEPEPTSGAGRVFPIYNPGDAAAPFTLTMNNTTTGPERALVGFTSDNVVEYLNTNACCLQFEDWTNGTDTVVNTAAASSPGSGNTGKKTTFVTANATRATYTLTDATTLTALRGRTWLVMLRLAPADNSYIGTITLTNPSGSANPFLVATSTGAASAQYYDLLMGTWTFPADASWTSTGFTANANRTSGTGNIIWDCITFVPAPNACFIDGTGAGVTATKLAVSNAELGTVFRTDSAGVLDVPTIDPRGPVPLVAPPGLSAVYSMWTEYPSSTVWDVSEFRDDRADVLSFKSKHKPRYLT